MRIETERLVIAEFTMDMAQAVHENSLDEDTRRFVPDEVFETLEDAQETVEFLMSQYGSEDGPLVYPVLTKEGGINIGYVQMVPLPDGKKEIGYHVAKKYTGNGYATEAVKAFLSEMNEKHGITEVYGICLAENIASVHVLKKAGFTVLFEGEGEYQGETREIFKSVWRKKEANMNYFVEGLQGSGKSTLVGKLAEKHPGYTAIREGEYSPVELAWCAYLTPDEYAEVLEKYPELREQIVAKTYEEGEHFVVCYTKVRTDNHAFYQDLEQHEIYNGRIAWEDFRRIVLERYRNFQGDGNIFECSIFQNIVEDMILFRVATDEEIVGFYKDVRKALDGKAYRIMYLKAEDIAGNLAVIRKERSDENGKELWFPLMIGFFDNCPYSKAKGTSGEADLIAHFAHRQALELRILEEVFPDKSTILCSKGYTDEEL